MSLVANYYLKCQTHQYITYASMWKTVCGVTWMTFNIMFIHFDMELKSLGVNFHIFFGHKTCLNLYYLGNIVGVVVFTFFLFNTFVFFNISAFQVKQQKKKIRKWMV